MTAIRGSEALKFRPDQQRGHIRLFCLVAAGEPRRGLPLREFVDRSRSRRRDRFGPRDCSCCEFIARITVGELIARDQDESW